ncbi:MAG: preprotein translocase subunit YajC [Veillonella sp.]|nr:preprotein translocase subunit YajC [Veillonella sp.]
MGDIQQILQTSWPILLMVVIFYFLLWRPQKKQQKERASLLGSLKKDQKIVTIGGIYGEIVELDDEKVKVQVSEKVELTFARTAVANVLSKKNKSGKSSH